MKHFAIVAPLSVCMLAAATLLTGCGDAFSFPASSSNPVTQQVAMAPIQGSDYGGHAPLAGAHIYLVQPGTGGYGSVVKSLLTANSANASFPTVKNGNWTNSTYGSDQFVPTTDANGNPFYGIQADATSNYQLSGDYTCTVGQPVILIGYGGSPTFPSGSNTFNVSQVAVSNLTGAGTTETATYTFTTTTVENMYIGEQVTLANLSNPASAPNISTLNGTTSVLSTNLTTTTFAITGADASGANPAGTYALTSGTATVSPTFNPAAVNMAVLGNCPSSGNFSTAGNGAISYIYMNEVSTTAAAYAFAGFTNNTAVDQNGNDEFHIGSPNTTQALQGIANSSITARKIYDITGSQITTSYAGEGHIANKVTPLTTSGGATIGIVPQAMIDTIANILAACVDSNNTYRNGTGTISPACNTLESTAQDNGIVDGSTITTSTTSHVPFNIAQAAFNMARFPSGAGTTSTLNGAATANNASTASSYVSALYGIPTANVPFTPNLASSGQGKPNDFSIIISYSAQGPPLCPTGTRCGFDGFDIDVNGNVLSIVENLPSTSTSGVGGILNLLVDGSATEFLTPVGDAIANNTDAGTGQPQRNSLTQIGINNVNNYFVSGSGTGTNSQGIFVWAPPNVQPSATYGAGYVGNATGLIVDETETIAMTQGINTTAQINKTFSSTLQANAPFPIVGSSTAAANTAAACVFEGAYLAEDNAKNLWTNSFNFDVATPGNSVCEFNSAGALLYSFFLPTYSGTTYPAAPGQMAIDRNNNLLYTDGNFVYLARIAGGQGTASSPVTATAPSVLATGGTLSVPRGVAVDGVNSIWAVNGDSGNGPTAARGSIVHYQNGTSAITNITPTYLQGSGTFTYIDPRTSTSATILDLNFVQVDPSGNVWAGGDNQGQLYEWVGAGAPTITPLAVARVNNTIGIEP